MHFNVCSLKDSGVYTCLVTKWDSTKNTYDWLYSDFSNVEVTPKGKQKSYICKRFKMFNFDKNKLAGYFSV